MLVANSLKSKLVNYIKEKGILHRREAHRLARLWKYEPSNVERRMRELRHEVGVIPLNDKLKLADTDKSEHVVAWKFKRMTVFN
jgi:hypothetical protein